MSTRRHKHLPPPSLEELGLPPTTRRPSGDDLPKPKKFRFQLLADFIDSRFDKSIRIADVGGGKGFLTYLLGRLDRDASVIDPQTQPLPAKYRDLRTGRRERIPSNISVPRIAEPFEIEHAKSFHLLVGLHAHGSNLLMLQAAAQFDRTCLLMPCCVIGEPASPPVGESWFMWLAHNAEAVGLNVEFFHLNFKGQNVGFIAQPR